MQNVSCGVLYTALIGFGRFCRSLSIELSIYLHWRGAFGVARFDKLGDARASTRGTSDKNRLRAFSYAFKPSINYVNMVAIGKEEN